MNAMGKKAFKIRFEILLPVVIFIVAAIYIPGGVLAEEIGIRAQSGAEATAATGAAVQMEKANDTAYRIKPLQNKLAVLNTADLEAAISKYKDMSSHWSRKEVGKLTCIEIIEGVNGMFLPESPVQVDQFIKMTVRAMGFAPGQATKYWAQNYIDTAVQQKLIAKNEFQDYRRVITREEAARIIVKATLMKEEFPYKDPYNNPDNLVRSKILDYAKIKDANKQFVLQSYQIGLIAGSSGKFMPSNTLTRAEAATIITRYLDTASRVPFKPAEGEVYTYIEPDGTVVTAYPPPKMEVIKAANAFEKAWPKSKGFVDVCYAKSDYRVMYTFYESEEVYERDSILTMQMGVDLDTINDMRLMLHPYYITVYDATAVKKLHRDSIYEMFRYWFEKDISQAIAAFDRYLDYATNNDQKHRIEEITYNKRLMYLHKVGGNDGFTLTIYSQP